MGVGGIGRPDDRRNQIQRQEIVRQSEAGKAAKAAEADAAAPKPAAPHSDSYARTESTQARAKHSSPSTVTDRGEAAFKSKAKKSSALLSDLTLKHADPSGITSAVSAVQNLPIRSADDLKAAFQRQMQSFALESPVEFKKLLKQAYGDKIDLATADKLCLQAKEGRFPVPKNVQFVDGATLHGANAAYSPLDGGTAFLNQDLLVDRAKLLNAFTEEAGHHLDKVLGGDDSRGDEGQILQKGLAKGGKLSTEELAAARTDRDHGTVTLDGKPVTVEFQAADSTSVASKVTDLMSCGLTDWAVTHGNTREAFTELKKLDSAGLGQALSKLEDNGALATLLAEMPKETRVDFMDLVRRCGNAQAQTTVSQVVSSEITDLMGGVVQSNTDARVALEKLQELESPMLGQTLEALRDNGNLPTLLAEMPTETRASFVNMVKDSGDSKAQAVVAKAVSNEMDKLQEGEIGWLKYPLAIIPCIGPALHAAADIRNRSAVDELQARQKELHQLFGANAAGTVNSLVNNGDLLSVQRNLIQPPTEENRRALFGLAQNLKDDPAAAAHFMLGIANAMADVSGSEKVFAAVAEGFALSAGVVEWSPQPMIEALKAGDQKELGRFLESFQQQFHANVTGNWHWTDVQEKQFDQAVESWTAFRATGKLGV